MSPEKTRKPKTPMTEELFRRIKELSDLEQTSVDIAKKLQITPTTVQRWRKYSMKDGMAHIKYYNVRGYNRPKYVSTVMAWDPKNNKPKRRRLVANAQKAIDETRNGAMPVAQTRHVEGITLGQYRILVTCPVCQGAGQVNAKLDLDSESHNVHVETNANVHNE